MKKFFTTKLNKQQWRVTVPNLNPLKFQKMPLKDEHRSNDSKRSSGFYDFQEAQVEYDKSRSLPNSVYVDTGSSDGEEDEFEDARPFSDKNDKNKENVDTDMEVYADIEASPKIVSKNIDQNNSQFEYDVPRISFKFFKDEIDGNNEAIYENNESVEPVKKKHVSELNIMLSHPEKQKEGFFKDDTGEENTDFPLCLAKEDHVSQAIFTTSSDNISIDKPKLTDSEPSVTVCHQNDDNGDFDEGFYKIPRSLIHTHTLSQSLNHFDGESIHNVPTPMGSNRSSIEHISASQVSLKNLDYGKEETFSKRSENSITIGLPRRLRRSSILKKPKDKWNNFRSKFGKRMQEHAAQQRVGAFNDKEKVTINLEEMYNSSKTKCKKVFQNTSKIFHKKRNQDSDESKGGCAGRVGLTSSDIEYVLNISGKPNCAGDINDSKLSVDSNFSKNGEAASDINGLDDSKLSTDESKNEDFDLGAVLKGSFRRLFSDEGQNGFEDLRRYVKQGGDFCKELSTILQERAEAETQYAKSLSKLSTKLSRACREGVGGLNDAWKAVALELESRAEGHRLVGIALLEETAKPLRVLTESQHRLRKQSEAAVDKSARSLSDWRASEAKGKKHSHTCARENEKLQDAAVLDTTKYGKQTISKSTSLIHLAHLQNKHNTSDKENTKLEGKKRKAEDAVKKADIEYYTLCVRSERARLEWESAVLRGASTFQALEEERLNNLKSVLTSYLHHSSELGPRLVEATERLKSPITQAEPTKDITALQTLRQNCQQVSEQLLPDFYCEHITLAMNRERRKQALVKLLHLIRQDIERERKSKNGLENLSKAIKQTPNFGSEDSQQSVVEKLYHMRSMLTYLEGARYKVQSALAELDSRPRAGHPLAAHITVTRDKSGLQQSVLKVPQWLRDEYCHTDRSPVSEKSLKSEKSDNSEPQNTYAKDSDWLNRGAADGNSNQPDSDFDDFSSECSSASNPCTAEEIPLQPIATCRAIYPYTPNMNDELPLSPGDILSVYRQQDDGWCLGECNGSVGIFPATYVEIIKDC